ncbi:acyl carrier protein [Streptomyces sp. Tu 2975]|jgi:acyl carrier protein|uniref:phosphopantetheine-binding protein n=1 Tax=Streptomyces sp. Tu 2975 TaxID=2676871 RepID=UPI00135AAAFE|nr:phosphopantetheine-binding protein [Streptomyces sp. Tu 2975]QIP84235.1 acyl carrier protein [Streptomyces sp. Tu 2975]
MTSPDDFTRARILVKECLDLPALADTIGDQEVLVLAGVNSGELIRVVQRCEEALGRTLNDDELTGIDSIAAVAALLSDGRAG